MGKILKSLELQNGKNQVSLCFKFQDESWKNKSMIHFIKMWFLLTMHESIEFKTTEVILFSKTYQNEVWGSYLCLGNELRKSDSWELEKLLR